jgi:hypothetical protein
MFTGSMKFILALAGLMVIGGNAFSQQDVIPVRDDVKKMPQAEIVHKLDLGIGLGIDYGGLLGVQIGYAPVKHLTLFAAGGYYMIDFGWGIGAKGLFIPKTDRHVVRPFLKAMFGTNSVIYVIDFEEYNATYLGFTAGAGVEFRFGRKKANGFDLDLNVPFRSPDYWIDYNTMKNDPRLEIIQDVLPVAFSVGYHHEF